MVFPLLPTQVWATRASGGRAAEESGAIGWPPSRRRSGVAFSETGPTDAGHAPPSPAPRTPFHPRDIPGQNVPTFPGVANGRLRTARSGSEAIQPQGSRPRARRKPQDGAALAGPGDRAEAVRGGSDPAAPAAHGGTVQR